jgi:hypothetical protein
MKRLILVVLVILTISCKEKDVEPNACGQTVSIDDIPWLAALKNDMENCSCIQSIITAKYESQTVFYVAVTDPLCDVKFEVTLYNCKGKKVKSFKDTPDEKNEFYNEVSERSVLYSCEKE